MERAYEDAYRQFIEPVVGAQRRASRPRHLPDLSMHRDTRIVHAGYRKTGEPGPFLAGPQFSSTFTSPGDPAAHALTYGRFHNPTWTAWEEALRSLEGGETSSRSPQGWRRSLPCSASRFGPATSLVLAGGLLLHRSGGWRQRGSKRLACRCGWCPPATTRSSAHSTGARLLWLETPTNPMLDVCDIRALADAARARGALVAVDNTTATPYLQQPLALGATFVVASDTKAMSGHSDLILGHVGNHRRAAGGCAPVVAHAARRHSRSDGGVAGAPVAADTARCG